jgi:hypothetical protein
MPYLLLDYKYFFEKVSFLRQKGEKRPKARSISSLARCIVTEEMGGKVKNKVYFPPNVAHYYGRNGAVRLKTRSVARVDALTLC